MENHKGLFTAALIVSVAAVLISLGSLYFLFSITDRLDVIDEKTSILGGSLASVDHVCTEAEQIFILREYEGVIGVFTTSGVLADVLDVQVMSLPEADREMLKIGIYAFTRSELMALIEDYTG